MNSVVALIRPSFNHDQGTPVSVQGELVIIPYRIQQDFNPTLPLTDAQALIHACVLSRHHDGRVRERQVERLTRAQAPWVAPFVAQLCGEYVVEILHAVERNSGLMNREIYGEFFSRNSTYMALIRQRMISYWNCYYRGQHRNYVGFRLFELFREWQASYPKIGAKS
ncbi:hypothetical protein ABE485_04480 [Achromobacter spanius]|uniref:hypothetical protein n=1 Tax=Achromobacter spanius TaxID=217203 RepID=UPI00320AFB09